MTTTSISMTTLKTKTKRKNVELTGNPFVDTGLATIAVLSGCKTIGDLTLRRMKNVHSDGTKLARTNLRLRSTNKIFPDSLLTNPSFKNEDKARKNYAKITTALLNNIGHEEQIYEMCEVCGNTSSLDLDKLYKDTIKERNKKKNKKAKAGERSGDNDYETRYIGRDWFPLTGSIANDAQVLPSSSRSLNICATCLFAVQYLPQSVLVTKGGLLTLFQSTSTPFWYKLVRSIVNDMSARLSAQRARRVETLGAQGGGTITAVNKTMDIMQRMKMEPGTSLTRWMFSNAGNMAHCEIDEIPNFALNFLDKARQHGLRNEINDLMSKENQKHTSYEHSLLNSILVRRDYLAQYPSKRFSNEGVSPELFFLYQTHIRNYSAKSLHTAHKIALYIIDSKLDPGNKKHKYIGIEIDKDVKSVKKWIINMAEEGCITFDEYYDLFFSSRNRNPWNLIKYYLLKPDTVQFSHEEKNDQQQQNQGHKNAIIKIGKRIFNSYIERKGEERFKKEVLIWFAGNKIGENWLRNQFERLVDEAEEAGGRFDYIDNWNLCINKQGREVSIHDLLYLFRVLFTTLYFYPTTLSTPQFLD